MLKRTFDIAAALGLLLLTAPLFLLVAALVLAFLGRPLLFRQRRTGRDGVPFVLLKFRTMRLSQEQGVRGVATDPKRRTRLGDCLRTTSLDELPELWNVLRGEMSLVGPRPLLTEYLDHYTPRQTQRHRVRPGITGLAQVRGRNSLSWEQRFEYDLQYVETQSFGLDLIILMETAVVVLLSHGNSQDPARVLPPFGADRSRESVAPAAAAAPGRDQG